MFTASPLSKTLGKPLPALPMNHIFFLFFGFLTFFVVLGFLDKCLVEALSWLFAWGRRMKAVFGDRRPGALIIFFQFLETYTHARCW